MPPESCHYPADGQAVHFGVFSSGALVSVITAHPDQSGLFTGAGQWRIRGMATDAAAQGRGYGGMALRALLAWSRQEGVPLLWCNARERAIPFYERHGFQVVGERFDIPGIGPHKVMWAKP
jgi:GNAT superfamily N-acetyltransferase